MVEHTVAGALGSARLLAAAFPLWGQSAFGGAETLSGSL